MPMNRICVSDAMSVRGYCAKAKSIAQRHVLLLSMLGDISVDTRDAALGQAFPLICHPEYPAPFQDARWI